MASFHIDSRLSKINADIQRSYLWELSIPNIIDLTGIEEDDDFTIRCRSASIPSKGNEPIESRFLGMPQFFAGRPTFGNTLAVTIEEFEDHTATDLIDAWQEKVFATRITNESNAGRSALSKRDTGTNKYTLDAYLTLYSQNESLSTKKQWRFFNMFPISKDEVNLDYTSNNSVIYSVTFQFDRWELV